MRLCVLLYSDSEISCLRNPHFQEILTLHRCDRAIAQFRT